MAALSAQRASDAEVARLSASAALTLADEHEQLYPNGIFVQEREMLRIEAELTLGKRHDALERAHAFAERFAAPRIAHASIACSTHIARSKTRNA